MHRGIEYGQGQRMKESLEISQKISFKEKGQYIPPVPHTRVDHYSKPQDPQASML